MAPIKEIKTEKSTFYLLQDTSITNFFFISSLCQETFMKKLSFVANYLLSDEIVFSAATSQPQLEALLFFIVLNSNNSVAR